MSNMAVGRIRHELNEAEKDHVFTNERMKLYLVDDNLLHLRGEVPGPKDTPYAGGRFVFDIAVPETYPFDPPKVHFITRIWHPNISPRTGTICLNILRDEWYPTMSLLSLFISLQTLLGSVSQPNPKPESVGLMFIQKMDVFIKTATHWTNVYAQGPVAVPEYDKLIDAFKAEGFPEHTSRIALSQFNWDVHNARMLLTMNKMAV